MRSGPLHVQCFVSRAFITFLFGNYSLGFGLQLQPFSLCQPLLDRHRQQLSRPATLWLSSPQSEDLDIDHSSPPCEVAGEATNQSHFNETARSADGISHPILMEDDQESSKLTQGNGIPKLTRRQWIQATSAFAVGGAALEMKKIIPNRTDLEAFSRTKKVVRPLNATLVLRETSINVTMQQGPPLFYFALDPNTFQKKRALMLPSWIPSFLVPPPVVIRDITNEELLSAAVVAGSIVEMARTMLLYPLLTLKTRVQSDINTRRKKGKYPPLRLGTRFKYTLRTAEKHWNEGDLYAGLLPALFITVPSTGLYYGVRDVVKRTLMPVFQFPNGNIPVLLLAAFAGDVVALAFRTPADTLSIRLQTEAANAESNQLRNPQNCSETKLYFVDVLNDTTTPNHDDDDTWDSSIQEGYAGNWFFESIERLPAVIITDLPYLLSRIALNSSILKLQGPTVGVGRYEATVVFTAILCAFLTTPFDVVRTRILIDSSTTSRGSQPVPEESSVGIDMGSGEGIFYTFQKIYNEGDGGARNLFAGWLERTAYLGIGRACLEPLQLIGYMAIRDFILLQWFD
mmetsp:Transcript_18024/g.49066  ORF Transcript_18024/g.49066 Transcript_18024/m.49066 type:complete len:571 (+) Transcript_18024:76-1788(+)